MKSLELAFRRILSTGALDHRNVELEGHSETLPLIHGFELGAELSLTSAPAPKIIAFRNLILPNELHPGNMKLRHKAIRKLRGFGRQSINAASYWELTHRPIECILWLFGETDTLDRRGNTDIVEGFSQRQFNTDRQISQVGDMFAKLFTGRMDKLLEIHILFSRCDTRENDARLAGESTPLLLGWADWAAMGFFLIRPR